MNVSNDVFSRHVESLESLRNIYWYSMKMLVKRVNLKHLSLSSTGLGRFHSTFNTEEVKKFSDVGNEWWNKESNHGTGPLHAMNACRVGYVRQCVANKLGRLDLPPMRQLAGLKVLDVGCGGGLLSEALARLGANVTSIDPSTVRLIVIDYKMFDCVSFTIIVITKETIQVARRHSALDPLTSSIDYRNCTIEDIRKNNETFDVICSLEVCILISLYIYKYIHRINL